MTLTVCLSKRVHTFSLMIDVMPLAAIATAICVVTDQCRQRLTFGDSP